MMKKEIIDVFFSISTDSIGSGKPDLPEVPDPWYCSWDQCVLLVYEYSCLSESVCYQVIGNHFLSQPEVPIKWGISEPRAHRNHHLSTGPLLKFVLQIRLLFFEWDGTWSLFLSFLCLLQISNVLTFDFLTSSIDFLVI